MYSRNVSSGSWPIRSARRLATPLTAPALESRRARALDRRVHLARRDDLVGQLLGRELGGRRGSPGARRRSPTKRGRRRFAAPGMIPSLRAGSVQRRALLGEDVVDGQQQLAAAADRVRLRGGDPQLLGLRPRLSPRIDLVHEPEVADREEQVGDLAAVEVGEVQAGAEDAPAGVARVLDDAAAQHADLDRGSSRTRSIAASSGPVRRVVLGVEVARVAQLDRCRRCRRALDGRGAEVDAARCARTPRRCSSASVVGRSITSIRCAAASGWASTWPSSWPCAISQPSLSFCRRSRSRRRSRGSA